jgi:hypothetical protein
LQQGPVLKDGDTAGLPKGDSLSVRYAMSRHAMPPRPVFQLNANEKN